MSEQDNNQQAAPSKEFVAHETADCLLRDAIQSVSKIASPYLKDPTSAILIVGHAMIAKADSMETSQLEEARKLRESLDSLSARIDRLAGL